MTRIGLWALAALGILIPVPAGADGGVLRPGFSIERELPAGASHTYSLHPGDETFVHVVVEQLTIDVVVELMDPTADPDDLLPFDRTEGETGEEALSVIAGGAGSSASLSVRARDPSRSGRYRLRVSDWRPPRSDDGGRIAAQRALASGEWHKRDGNPEQLPRAIESFRQAVDLWRSVGDPPGEAAALLGLGIAVHRSERQEEALEHFRAALELWRELGDRSAEARTLSYCGAAHVRLGQVERAADYFGQSLEAYRGIGDLEGEARAHSNLGVMCRWRGLLEQSLEHYTAAREIFDRLEDRAGEAGVLANIGVVHRHLGELDLALQRYREALELAEGVDGFDDGITLFSIGDIHRLRGESRQALRYLERARQRLHADGMKIEEAQVLNGIGLVHAYQGEPQLAIERFREALQLQRLASDRWGEASTFNNIALAQVLTGQLEPARDTFKEALGIWREVGDRVGEATSLSGLGLVYFKLDDLDLSLASMNQALEISRATNRRLEVANTLNNIGWFHYETGRIDKAKEILEESLALSKSVGYPPSRVGSLVALAHIARDRGQFAEARGLIEKALRQTETLRDKIAGQRQRASFLAPRQGRFEFFVDMLAQQHRKEPEGGYDVEALQVVERARARSLLETLGGAGVDFHAGADRETLERERQAKRLLRARSTELARLTTGENDPEQVETARIAVDAALVAYERARAETRAQSPQFADLTRPQPLDPAEIQRLLGDETLLLEYSLGEERSYLWAVTSDSLELFELPPRQEIETVARRAYERLSVSHQRQAQRAAADAARQLSRLVLAPVRAKLDFKRLAIVPDGVLQYVPFAALPDPRADPRAPLATPRPLILEHEIVQLPSASVLARLRERQRKKGNAAKQVAVLADPVFSADDPRVDTSSTSSVEPSDGSSRLRSEATREGDSFRRLPFTREEATSIAGLAANDGATRVRVFEALDFEASRQTLLSPPVGGFDIVHLATHGLVNSRHPELSGIVLSMVDRRGSPQNGLIRLHEIYELDWEASLVVLSACQTAMGKEVRGEGLMSLTRGFMNAGAPQVIASLWDVRDRATAELMNRFYQHMLSDGMKPAAALRAAQVSMWNDRRWRAPYYWAGFGLHGDWR